MFVEFKYKIECKNKDGTYDVSEKSKTSSSLYKIEASSEEEAISRIKLGLMRYSTRIGTITYNF